MSYQNSRKNVLSANLVVMAITAVAVWQFYKFVTFKDPSGVLDAQGGIQHFWWAVGLGVLACAIAFLFFSVLLRYDSNDETHITSPPPPKEIVAFCRRIVFAMNSIFSMQDAQDDGCKNIQTECCFVVSATAAHPSRNTTGQPETPNDL